MQHNYMLHYLVENKINILIIYYDQEFDLFFCYKQLQDYVMIKKYWVFVCYYYRKGMTFINIVYYAFLLWRKQWNLLYDKWQRN